METVAFYSYKGGVGRSLLLVNAARFLALTGRRVVALDLDFEAPGLHYKFGVHDKVEVGAVRLLSRSLAGDLPSLDELRAASVETPLVASEGGWVRLLAAGPAPSRAYWAELGRFDEQLSMSHDVGLLEAMLDLQARIEEAWAPDVLLVDARTGVTGLGGIATMALSDRVMLLTTPARESIDGVHAVAESLRATPSLRTGERKLEFVVSRVQGTERVDRQELREKLGQYFLLPNDPIDGGAERMLGGNELPRYRLTQEKRLAENSLLAATLAWIAGTFPADATLAQSARRRLVVVEQALHELMEAGEHVSRWFRAPDHWSDAALSTGVRVEGDDGSVRVADIVARLEDGSLALVIEYADDEDPEVIARWWTAHLRPRIVVVLEREWERKLFAVDAQSRIRLSERQDLPGPREFELLDDPSDLSIENLLRVKDQYPYDQRLVVEWVLSCFFVRQSARSKQILDGLTMGDRASGARILRVCSRGAPEPVEFLLAAADDFDRLVHENLCAPLCWRVDPQAFVAASRKDAWGPPPVAHGLRRLAGFMGLTYDPPEVLRREAAKLEGGDINQIREAFEARELRYDWSEHPLEYPPELAANPYHGHLGSYTPETGRIVLAAPSIESVAKTIAQDPRHVGSLALLHLSVLGLLHNGVDLDGRRWEDFTMTVAGGVPPVTVVLAQFFMHRFLVELDDEHLTRAFDALTDHQAPEYRAWRSMTQVALEDGRAWMSAIRRGTGGCAPVDVDALLSAR